MADGVEGEGRGGARLRRPSAEALAFGLELGTYPQDYPQIYR
jgi:hypothetical protein